MAAPSTDRAARLRARKAAPAEPSGTPRLDPASIEPEDPELRDELEATALDPEAGVMAFLVALDRGEPWYPALLSVIARWTAAEEIVDGIHHTYLIGGEAFDWLRLAERLIIAAGSRIPAEAAERLLVRGEAPDGSDEEDFARAIGPLKHRAHLNFQYGVVVEETLLLSAEMEHYKARTIDGPRGEPPDIAVYEHVYGKPLGELFVLYNSETGNPIGSRISESQWQSFTYWCSKYRFKTGEPARVASDTRKALALLSRLRSDRARPTTAPPPEDYIDTTLADD